MKTFKKLVITLFILFSINTVCAQYGNNGYGNGYGRANNGMNQMNQGSQDEKPIEVPIEKLTAEFMEKITPAINLDELQVIAISNVIKESIRTQRILLKQNFSEADQQKNFEALSETTDRKIGEFLNKDQKEKYILFKEEIKNPSKSNSRKKKK